MKGEFYVKVDLSGIPAGRVETFFLGKAAAYLVAGYIEPFDEKNKAHVSAKQEQEKEARAAAAATEKRLRLERENPEEYQRQVRARMEAMGRAQLAERARLAKERLADEVAKEEEGQRLLVEHERRQDEARGFRGAV